MTRPSGRNPFLSGDRPPSPPLAGATGNASQAVLESLFSAFAERFEAALVRHAVPGGAVALHYYDQQWSAGFGVTNVDHPLPIEETTLFQVGGITKLVTALALAILAEGGWIDLDEPVRSYLPSLRLADARVAERVTVRQLLNHTGGWYGDDLGGGESGPDAAARYLPRLASAPQLLPLGTRFSINDSGYVVAARILEEMSGRSYPAAVRALVLAPLGMTRSFFEAREVVTTRYAIGHALDGGQPKVHRGWTTVPAALAAAGGLCASVQDLLRLGMALKGDEPSLLSKAGLAAFHEPTTDRGVLGREEFAGFGVGVMVWEAGGNRYFGQTGSTDYQVARLVYHPAADFVLALATNAASGERAIADVLPFALEQYIAITTPPLAIYETATSTLNELAGRYGFSDSKLGPSIAVVVREGMLRFDYGGDARLELVAPDSVVVAEGPLRGTRAEFLRDSAGVAAWLRLDGKVYPRLR
jgi:CubicO group peptidase (beta-lactamase class C family)